MDATQLQEKTVLSGIERPTDVQQLSSPELIQLAGELRRLIIDTVATTGGHLAPSLGVVELTLALLRAFDPSRDKIVWDVGHQAYVYKILTGRRDRFGTLRSLGGISGFPKMSESAYDHFGVGHSSTSISAALGMACGRDLKGRDNRVVAVIGDGSMTAGQAYEGLNQAGGLHSDMIVVLNDNEMSISRNVGALSSFFSRNLTKSWVVRFKKDVESILKSVPKIGEDLATYARKSEEAFKHFFTPGMLFEAFRFNYLGPFDGHNIDLMTSVFEQVKKLSGPVLVHVLTKKGKGYQPAEDNPTYFHGVGCFEPETGLARKFGGCSLPSYTDVFGQTLCRMAEEDQSIIAITAAMPEGTGLDRFRERFPDRFVDVGICEQHAVTFAAGLATEGFKPVVVIYSTFMQRSYDQIVHDVCLQNLPVVLCLDRGGLVGEDGPTHHGAFDMSYLRHIPNLVFMAPADEAELQRMLVTAIRHDGPVALRYPRGVGLGTPTVEKPEPLPLGEGCLLRDGTDAVVVAIGSRVNPSLAAAEELERETGASVAVFNARFIRPMPEAQLIELAGRFSKMLLVEENVLKGGFGSGVLEVLSDNGALSGVTVKRLGLPDGFVEHGKQKELRARLGIDKVGIRRNLEELLASA
ncbi:1-deoxy-D-xylulose-5-phosphate synthase [Desulfobaculum xiamenense]|uniref:1-deoxy-D-xylulose-5-phosphate synthase n=1 Tax=Desulfobaculum xiamenense TaxID=995050 RepID=A0A846QXM5_9BACT|nr:1-deoxy-D-xylulose-5-phosphate synthase [Desulfobaculum xiamenense]NJB69379.1 1-deoxy-D-xylulose-5-phosphate synthase [Desulfobaculum xiamenense]